MLQLQDVRPFNADYTLDPIATDYQISKGILRTLLLSIYEQLNALDVDSTEEVSQNLQEIFPKEIHLPNVFLSKQRITKLIKYGLLERIDDEIYSLTDKSIEIFTKASNKQKEMDTI